MRDTIAERVCVVLFFIGCFGIKGVFFCNSDIVRSSLPPPLGLSASLPCYSSKNVNQQRGSGVFDRSISALLALNEAGYGVEGSGLVLDLVYNPFGAFLPPPQEGERIRREEAKYKFVVEF